MLQDNSFVDHQFVFLVFYKRDFHPQNLGDRHTAHVFTGSNRIHRHLDREVPRLQGSTGQYDRLRASTILLIISCLNNFLAHTETDQQADGQPNNDSLHAEGRDTVHQGIG